MCERRGTVPTWVAIAAAALFLLHAANYLYFFVDDEAIPFVYAQNLLRRRGLSYNTLEGRLEGYSDFLHVVWSTGVLAIVRAAYMPTAIVITVLPQHRDALARLLPWVASMKAVDGNATAYVCRDFACQVPATSAGQLEDQLRSVRL